MSRWDSCAAQAVLEASGGCLIKLRDFEKDEQIRSYRYRAPPTSGGAAAHSGSAAVVPAVLNADFESGLVKHSVYNSRQPELAPASMEKVENALPYVNLMGQVSGDKCIQDWCADMNDRHPDRGEGGREGGRRINENRRSL